jgi:regulator of nucleoside diphosphate kinase
VVESDPVKARAGIRANFRNGVPLNTSTPITVSSRDVERLEQLLEQPSWSKAPGIDALRGELARANIVEPGDMPADIVTMNSTACVEDESTGATHELTLVYPRDADGSAGKVSVFAPVGSAMLGLRVGQSIEWTMPGGRHARLRVTSIRYQPEASGDLHR